jgi:hypothetical protein
LLENDAPNTLFRAAGAILQPHPEPLLYWVSRMDSGSRDWIGFTVES